MALYSSDDFRDYEGVICSDGTYLLIPDIQKDDYSEKKLFLVTD